MTYLPLPCLHRTLPMPLRSVEGLTLQHLPSECLPCCPLLCVLPLPGFLPWCMPLLPWFPFPGCMLLPQRLLPLLVCLMESLPCSNA